MFRLPSLMHVIDRAMGTEENQQHHQNVHSVFFLITFLKTLSKNGTLCEIVGGTQ